MPVDYKPKTIKPSRSAPLRFAGRILAETQWDTKDGCWMRFTVWETQGGAYVAVIDGDTPGKSDQIHCAATVIKPIFDVTGGRDETSMQIATLDAFDWHDRAKSMLKRELDWSPFLQID